MIRASQSEHGARAGRGGRAGRRKDAGTVLLLLIFLAAAMMIATAAVLPRLVMQGRREKEAELAWRGEQYVRAIKLYYRKYGHFPRSVEDFSKNPGNLHFLRKEYKDPMNSTDGTWRFIYVGPGGQLIGSLTRTMPLGVVPLTAATGNPFGNNPNGGPGGATGLGQPGSIFGATSPGATGPGGTGSGGTSQGGATQSGSQGAQGQPPAPPATSGDDSGDTPLPPAPVAPNQAIQNSSPMDSTVFGGQLVGVGSKVDRKSIRFYKGYGKYREWEFIWDPAAEAAAAAGLAPVGTGSLLPGGPQPAGSFSTGPTGPQPLGTTPPNPPQTNPPQ